VVLTKAAPSVSLTKHGSGSGLLRVNLNWNARPTGEKVGFFKSAPKPIDLDLGCLYEFADGSRGVVQALGNAFTAQPRSARERVIWLDGDDRSGTNSGGENLFINLDHADEIRRVMVFALIYEGVPNWAAADGVVTLFPASGPQIEVRLDDSTDGTRICGIAMLEHTGGPSGTELTFRREVRYLQGSQRTLDEAYGFGLRWSVGHK
jgi:tellurite resistance protein TerA